jgi:O-antigen/teichoic acid export membrane protein
MVGASAYLMRSVASGILTILLNVYVMSRYPLEELGYLAILLIISSVIFSTADFGIGHALVQKQKKISDHLASVSFINLLIIWSVAILTMGIFDYYANNNQSKMILALIIAAPIFALRQLAVSGMELRFGYSAIARIEVTESFGLFMTVMVLDGFGIGVWGYVIGFIVKGLIGYVSSIWYRTFKIVLIRPMYSLEWNVLIKFGIWYHMGTYLNAVRQLAIPISLSAMIGFAAAGMVDRAIFVAALVPLLLGSIQQRILFPYFSATQDQVERRNSAFERALHFSSSIDKLLYIPLLLMLNVFVVKFLSAEFLPMINLVWILAIANAAFGSLSTISISVLQGIGRSDIVAWIYLVNTTLPYVLVWPLVIWLGPLGAIIANMTAWVTLFIFLPLVAKQMPGVRFSLMASRSFVAFIGALIVGSLTQYGLNDFPNQLLNSIISTSAGLLSYLLILILIDRQGVYRLIDEIYSHVNKRRMSQ